VGLSAKHLHELFSRELGVTPHRYQLAQRMRRAQALLAATDLPITTIAFELGFSTSQQFSRTFRRQIGATPREYRRRTGRR
jgi:AraC-like DNA-binding protein